MTLFAFGLVMLSALLHASWNVLSKGSRPSASFFMLASMTSVVLWFPVFCYADLHLLELPLKFWLIVLISGASESLYFLGLFKAYRRNDVSLAYPMARALPVLFVAVVSLTLGLGERPGWLALFGMVVVTLGCLLLPLASWKSFSWRNYWNPALYAILMAAVGTTGYTVADSIAMPVLRAHSVNSGLVISGAYLFMIEVLISLSLSFYVRRHAEERREFKRLFLKSLNPVISGLFASSAYMLILIAMNHVSNVSYIQAFRQVSLPMGVFFGVFILKEKCTPPRLAGVALVIAGLVLTAI